VVRPFTWGEVGGQNVLLTDGTTDYLYGPAGVPLEQTSSAATSYYVHDQLGSTTLLVTAAGAITGSYAYSPFGKITVHTGSSTPLGYAGGYDDGETGLQLLQQCSIQVVGRRRAETERYMHVLGKTPSLAGRCTSICGDEPWQGGPQVRECGALSPAAKESLCRR
jgi:hypothetical protein